MTTSPPAPYAVPPSATRWRSTWQCGGWGGSVRLDIGAWPHRTSTENDSNRLLSNFPAEQTVEAGALPIFILLNQHRPHGCPRATLSRFALTLTLDAMDSTEAQVSTSWRAQRGCPSTQCLQLGEPDHRAPGKGPDTGHRSDAGPTRKRAASKAASGSTAQVQPRGSGEPIAGPEQPAARPQRPLPAARE